MSRHGDNREQRAEIRKAARDGVPASEAGVSTGASKQNTSLGGKQKAQANQALHEDNGKS
jgi:hypothetical protein